MSPVDPGDYRKRLIDIWAGWEEIYREPVGGWEGVERFHTFFLRERDAIASRVRTGTPASLGSDAAAMRSFVAAGGDLRLMIRGVDNMAEGRARLLVEIDALIEDLAALGIRDTEGQRMRQVNLRLPQELLAKLEALRGEVPRERFLRTILERHATYYEHDLAFDASEYVSEQPRLRKRDLAIAKALDAQRGALSRVDYLTQLVEHALGLVTRVGDNW